MGFCYSGHFQLAGFSARSMGFCRSGPLGITAWAFAMEARLGHGGSPNTAWAFAMRMGLAALRVHSMGIRRLGMGVGRARGCSWAQHGHLAVQPRAYSMGVRIASALQAWFGVSHKPWAPSRGPCGICTFAYPLSVRRVTPTYGFESNIKALPVVHSFDRSLIDRLNERSIDRKIDHK